MYGTESLGSHCSRSRPPHGSLCNEGITTRSTEAVQRFLRGGQSSAASEADQRRLLRASSFTLRFSGCVWGGGAEVGCCGGLGGWSGGCCGDWAGWWCGSWPAAPVGCAGPAAWLCFRFTSDTHTSPTCNLCTRSPYCTSVRSGLHDAHPLPYTKNGCSIVDSNSTWKEKHFRYWHVLAVILFGQKIQQVPK